MAASSRPLSQHRGEPQAFKIVIPATDRDPAPRTHTGYEWIYVLSGRLRLVLGEHDVVLGRGGSGGVRHPESALVRLHRHRLGARF